VADGFDQVPVGALDGRGVETDVAAGFRIKIEIVLAQPLELAEILVVIDGAEQAAELLEPVARFLIGKRARRQQGSQDVALADRNDVIPVARRAALVGSRIHETSRRRTIATQGQ
jgi:hypothetical protein